MPTLELPPSVQKGRVALQRYEVIGTQPERAFDRLARTLAQLCDTPTALLTFFEEGGEWVKASYGRTSNQKIPYEDSIGLAAAGRSEALVIQDLSESEHEGSDLVEDEGWRFYVGQPLLTDSGGCIGVLAAIDYEARGFDARYRTLLTSLASLCVRELETRTVLREQKEALKGGDSGLPLPAAPDGEADPEGKSESVDARLTGALGKEENTEANAPRETVFPDAHEEVEAEKQKPAPASEEEEARASQNEKPPRERHAPKESAPEEPPRERQQPLESQTPKPEAPGPSEESTSRESTSGDTSEDTSGFPEKKPSGSSSPGGRARPAAPSGKPPASREEESSPEEESPPEDAASEETAPERESYPSSSPRPEPSETKASEQAGEGISQEDPLRALGENGDARAPAGGGSGEDVPASPESAEEPSSAKEPSGAEEPSPPNSPATEEEEEAPSPSGESLSESAGDSTGSEPSSFSGGGLESDPKEDLEASRTLDEIMESLGGEADGREASDASEGSGGGDRPTSEPGPGRAAASSLGSETFETGRADEENPLPTSLPPDVKREDTPPFSEEEKEKKAPELIDEKVPQDNIFAVVPSSVRDLKNVRSALTEFSGGQSESTEAGYDDEYSFFSEE